MCLVFVSVYVPVALFYLFVSVCLLLFPTYRVFKLSYIACVRGTVLVFVFVCELFLFVCMCWCCLFVWFVLLCVCSWHCSVL